MKPIREWYVLLVSGCRKPEAIPTVFAWLAKDMPGSMTVREIS